MQSNQIALFDVTDFEDEIVEKPDLDSYDFILIMMSGGKDSLACLLNLIEAGVPLSKIEMWHHSVDGRGGRR
jgi:tRNA(Ile)-lysidine synthase TilS/MesJ